MTHSYNLANLSKEGLAHHRAQKDRLGRLPPEEPGK